MRVPIDTSLTTSDEANRLLRQLGFAAFDHVGTERAPNSGMLLGTDTLFVR